MAKNKTKPEIASVTEFIDAVADERKRQDSLTLLELITSITKESPVMWGSSIIGFGRYDYHYPSGHSGEAPLVGFSPREAAISLYIMPGFTDYESLMTKLGKHKTGKSCLYIKKLSDIDLDVLKQLIAESFSYMKEKHQLK